MIENGIDIAIENSAATADTTALAGADTDGLVSMIKFNNLPNPDALPPPVKMMFSNPATHEDIKNMFASEPDWSKYPNGLKKDNMKMYFEHKKAGGPVYSKLHGI